MVCLFLLYNRVNQLYVYIRTSPYLLLRTLESACFPLILDDGLAGVKSRWEYVFPLYWGVVQRLGCSVEGGCHRPPDFVCPVMAPWQALMASICLSFGSFCIRLALP